MTASFQTTSTELSKIQKPPETPSKCTRLHKEHANGKKKLLSIKRNNKKQTEKENELGASAGVRAYAVEGVVGEPDGGEVAPA